MTEPHEPVNAATSPAEVTKHLAYAEGSLMLIECVLLLLIEKRVLRTEEVVEAVETALELKKDFSRDGEHPRIADVAAGVLSTLGNSIGASRKGNER